MSTLQVNDPRSRGRSKSPGGRTRERSRSRSQAPELVPETRRGGTTKKYLDSDSADEDLRSTSRKPRSRGSSAVRGIQRSSRRYVSSEESEDSEDDRRKYRSHHDRYDHSDIGEDEITSRVPKYNGRPVAPDDRIYGNQLHVRQPSQQDFYADDSDSSTDEALAYGDLPGKRHRNYRLSSSPRSSREKIAGFFKRGSSRPEEAPAEAPSSHPNYARMQPYNYGDPVQSPHGPPGSNWAPVPECELPGFVPPTSQAEPQTMPGAFPTVPISTHPNAYPNVPAPAPVHPIPQYVNQMQHPNPYVPHSGPPLSIPTSVAYAPPVSSPAHQRQPSSDASVPYANLPAFQYAQIDPNVKYTSKTQTKAQPKAQPKPAYTYSSTPQFQTQTAQASEPQRQDVRFSATPQYSKPPMPPRPQEQQYVEITPGTRPSTRPHSLSVSSANNLTVAGPDPNLRPASPLQEPYRGTYQSISPMPSPIVATSKLDDDLSDMEPLDAPSDMDRSLFRHVRKKSNDKDARERKSERSKRDSSRVRDSSRIRHERHGSGSLVVISPTSAPKRVSFYDPSPDAIAMQEALSHTRNFDTKTLIRILPHLDSDEVLDLRKEYKNHVKLHGKGINVAKHIRLKLGNSMFGKVCYVTALGRWESEAFWANTYYQTNNSRRELLIESLMGRSNSEIHEIKECFRDSRYLDSLEKCMKAELKADKFRMAVLLALDERRQSERDPLDMDLIQRDIQELHRALVSREGGETAMIQIIVRRSDSHLRELLRVYEKIYKHNFAKAMISKSRNLVGETLAHILNGAINRPMRDALLLHQALRESRPGKERSELLISRLVRLHWEPRHLERVKMEFRKRYGERVEEAIAEELLTTTSGNDWGEFCIELARSSSVRKG